MLVQVLARHLKSGVKARNSAVEIVVHLLAVANNTLGHGEGHDQPLLLHWVRCTTGLWVCELLIVDFLQTFHHSLAESGLRHADHRELPNQGLLVVKELVKLICGGGPLVVLEGLDKVAVWMELWVPILAFDHHSQQFESSLMSEAEVGDEEVLGILVLILGLIHLFHEVTVNLSIIDFDI